MIRVRQERRRPAGDGVEQARGDRREERPKKGTGKAQERNYYGTHLGDRRQPYQPPASGVSAAGLWPPGKRGQGGCRRDRDGAAAQARPHLAGHPYAKMDGYEVAGRLRETPDCHHIPIVAVTALAMVGDREKLLTSGFDGYISKPIDPETFAAKVQDFLEAAAKADPVVHHPAEPPPAPFPVSDQRRKRAVLLFVDNTAANIHLARSQLEPQGYEILTATSALEGMALARRAKPDLIVSDVHMPHHDGYDFQSMVQADPELAQIPFVFLSSSVWSIREKETALTRGARKFISRPIEPEALVAELEACLPPAKEARKAQGSG